MDPRFQGIWKLALDSMTEDAPSETDLSSRSVEELKWLKEVMEKIGKEQTSDVDLMLEALKDAKAGSDIADNLHAAAEFCEDIDFAEVAVKNGQAIGVALKFIPYKEVEIRAAAARLLAAISQNNEKVQEKTVKCLSLLLKIASEEKEASALRFQLSAISTTARYNRNSIKKFFDLNGIKLLEQVLSEYSDVKVLSRSLFMATCLYEQSDIILEGESEKDAVDGMKKEDIKTLYNNHSIFEKAALYLKSNDCNLSENASNFIKLK